MQRQQISCTEYIVMRQRSVVSERKFSERQRQQHLVCMGWLLRSGKHDDGAVQLGRGRVSQGIQASARVAVDVSQFFGTRQMYRIAYEQRSREQAAST
jgi:hypothetical protein